MPPKKILVFFGVSQAFYRSSTHQPTGLIGICCYFTLMYSWSCLLKSTWSYLFCAICKFETFLMKCLEIQMDQNQPEGGTWLSDNKDQLKQGTMSSGQQVPYPVDLRYQSQWISGTREPVGLRSGSGGGTTTTWLFLGDTRLTWRQPAHHRPISVPCLGLCFAPEIRDEKVVSGIERLNLNYF